MRLPANSPPFPATVTFIVHCAVTFLQSALRILRLAALYIKSEAITCGAKENRCHKRTQWMHFSAEPTSRCEAKIRLWMWLTWETSRSRARAGFLSFSFFFLQAKTPATLNGRYPTRALGRPGCAVSITCAVRPIASLALCDFGRVCKFGSLSPASAAQKYTSCQASAHDHILPCSTRV